MSSNPSIKDDVSVSVWKFDPMHTQVEFSAKHLGMMTVRGHFNEVIASGTIRKNAAIPIVINGLFTTSAGILFRLKNRSNAT